MIKVSNGKLAIDFKRNHTENNKTDYTKYKWPALWVGIISVLMISIYIELAFEFKFYVMLLSLIPSIIVIGLFFYIMVIVWELYANREEK